VDIKLVNVILIKQTVLPEDNKLLVKHNAMLVLLAQLDKHSQQEDAKHQDHHATVTKNTTLPPTIVILANQDNSHRTHSMVDKILDAQLITQDVLQEDNSN
jgi:hypothetical protein